MGCTNECFCIDNFVPFCENSFCCNLKTNKDKYIKVNIFRKKILQGIYFNSQIFALKLHFWEITKNRVFFFFFFAKGKKEYFLTQIAKLCESHLRTCVYGTFFSLFWVFFFLMLSCLAQNRNFCQKVILMLFCQNFQNKKSLKTLPEICN